MPRCRKVCRTGCSGGTRTLINALVSPKAAPGDELISTGVSSSQETPACVLSAPHRTAPHRTAEMS